jgi:hypothetical protein
MKPDDDTDQVPLSVQSTLSCRNKTQKREMSHNFGANKVLHPTYIPLRFIVAGERGVSRF